MKRITLAAAAALLLAGCANSDAPPAPDGQTAEIDIITEAVTASGEEQESVSALKAADERRSAEIARQQGIEREIRFSPIDGAPPTAYGCEPQNLKCGTSAGFVCADRESGAVYFTDLNGTLTLSKYENGEVSELVPITAGFINLWDGCLYYIGRSDGKTGLDRPFGSFLGSIYRYNLATGENEVLVEADAAQLVVSEHGIDYTLGTVYSDDSSLFIDERIYHMDFDGTITENAQYPVIESCLGLWYGVSRLTAEDGAIGFTDPNGGFNAALSRKTLNVFLTIYGDWLCSRPALDTVYCLNLRTGEEYSYKTGFVQDYIWLDDTLYITTGTHIIACRDGKQKDYPISQPTPAVTISYDRLQTDGESILGVTSGGFRLHRLTLNEWGTGFEHEYYPTKP